MNSSKYRPDTVQQRTAERVFGHQQVHVVLLPAGLTRMTWYNTIQFTGTFLQNLKTTATRPPSNNCTPVKLERRQDANRSQIVYMMQILQTICHFTVKNRKPNVLQSAYLNCQQSKQNTKPIQNGCAKRKP